MVEKVDEKWSRTLHLLFRDDGPVKKGARTRTFAVVSRHSSASLGDVRWYSHWRQYTFFPAECVVFDRSCLREIADFCEDKTLEHRAKSKA